MMKETANNCRLKVRLFSILFVIFFYAFLSDVNAQNPRIIHFARNKSVLDNKAKLILDEIYAILRKDPTLTLTIHGFCDSSERLGELRIWCDLPRATTAKQYLTKRGLDETRIEVWHWGANCPAPSSVPEDNQRIECWLEDHSKRDQFFDIKKQACP